MPAKLLELTIRVSDDDLVILIAALEDYASECRYRAERESEVEVWTEANDFFLEHMDRQQAAALALRSQLEAAASEHERAIGRSR